MYDAELYPLPSKALQQLGVTAADLKGLGKGPEFEVISRRCSEIMHQKNPGITQARINEIRVATGVRVD